MQPASTRGTGRRAFRPRPSPRTTSSRRLLSSLCGSARTVGGRSRTRCSSTRSWSGWAPPRPGACSPTSSTRTIPRRRSRFRKLPYGCRQTPLRKHRRGRRELRRRAFEQPAFASNAVLVGAKRRDGTPSLRSGPAGGYFFRVLRGDGARRRRLCDAGAVFPGAPFVLIGRGPDFAWSATSSQADNVDLFVETLCTDDRHYVYRGECQAMSRFFVGTLKTPGSPDQPVAPQTTHGPVVGYATVGESALHLRNARLGGRELLESSRRSTSSTPDGSPRRSVSSVENSVESSFNWFYSDDRDVAFFSSGRLPLRAPGTDPRCRPRASATPTGRGSCRSLATRAGSTRLRG